jgi:hypothetical protein
MRVHLAGQLQALRRECEVGQKRLLDLAQKHATLAQTWLRFSGARHVRTDVRSPSEAPAQPRAAQRTPIPTT